MVGAHLKGLAVQPVGQAAVAHLAMVEGSHPQDHIQPMLRAQRNKAANIPSSGKIKDAFFFLHVVPEQVGGYDVHAAHAHLDQLILPAAFIHAAVMELAGHGKKGRAILFHIL